MAVTTERLPRSLVALQIEVEPDRVEASLERAAKKVANQVRIPGFRPGKAPRAIIERTVGRSALLQEALEDLLPELYNEAVESESLEPIDQPQFDLESMEPLVVKAQVPVRPTVTLGEYQALRAPKPDAEVTPEQLEETMTALRRRFATLEPVDRPVQWDDTVRANVTVLVDGQAEPHVEEDAEFRVGQDAVVSLPGFLERLVGLERGGPYEIEFALPEEFEAEELRGKQAHYTVTIHEVKQEILPELDDEFAKSLDEGFERVEELRARVESDAQTLAERNQAAAYHDEIVDLLVATAEMDYPEVLVDREVDRIIDEQSNHASHTQEGLDRWLEAIGQTEGGLREELRSQADLNVRRAIVVGEFVRSEGLEIDEAAIDSRIDELVTQMIGAQPGEPQHDQVRQLLNTDSGRSQIKSDLTTRQALERLAEITSQADDETASRARGTRRRRRGASDGEGEADDGENEPADASSGAEASDEAPGASSEAEGASEEESSRE